MKHTDLPLFLAVFFLTFFGIFVVYNASSVSALADFGDKFHFLREQMLWGALGFVSLFLTSKIHYSFWHKVALPMLLVTIILLIAVYVPGIGVTLLGARRWIDIGLTTLQPAEFAKLTIVVYLSAWLSQKEKGRLWAFLLLFLLVVGLVVFEPDMGTAFIIGGIALSLYFLSGAHIIQFALLIPAVVAAGIILILHAPYRLSRVLSFLSVDQDPANASYHIRQTLIALGTGGLTGVGFGQSLQKYAYLPESTTDSIFAIIAEELGFIGSTVIILLFIFIIFRGIKIATACSDQFGRLLALGIVSYLGIQVVINLSAVVSLIPFTGVPLPFISYGGSSLVVSLTSIGILLNISKHVSIT